MIVTDEKIYLDFWKDEKVKEIDVEATSEVDLMRKNGIKIGRI